MVLGFLYFQLQTGWVIQRRGKYSSEAVNVLPPPGGAQHMELVGSSRGHPSIAHPDHGVPSVGQLLGRDALPARVTFVFMNTNYMTILCLICFCSFQAGCILTRSGVH